MRRTAFAIVMAFFAVPGFAESVEPEKEAVPVMDLEQVVADAEKSSKVTGVTLPMTVISLGTIAIAPATP